MYSISRDAINLPRNVLMVTTPIHEYRYLIVLRMLRRHVSSMTCLSVLRNRGVSGKNLKQSNVYSPPCDLVIMFSSTIYSPPSDLVITQQTQNICIAFVQCWTNVEDAGPPLYKCYTNVLCLLGMLSRANLKYAISNNILQCHCDIILNQYFVFNLFTVLLLR